MSAQTDKGAAKTSGVVVSTGDKRRSAQLRLVAIGLGAVVVLALVILTVVLIHGSTKTSHDTATAGNINTGAVPTASAQAYKTVTDAESQASNGDYAGAQALLDDALKDATDKPSQAILYAAKGLIAKNNKQYDDALTFAQQAEGLNPTADSSLTIAEVYELQGNKPSAITYYQKTADRTPGYDKQDYLDKVKELSQ